MAVWLTASAACVGRAALNLIGAVQVAQRRRLERFETRAARGITLLRDWLSPQQREQFDLHHYLKLSAAILVGPIASNMA
jgi:hypothetical protein